MQFQGALECRMPSAGDPTLGLTRRCPSEAKWLGRTAQTVGPAVALRLPLCQVKRPYSALGALTGRSESISEFFERRPEFR